MSRCKQVMLLVLETNNVNVARYSNGSARINTRIGF